MVSENLAGMPQAQPNRELSHWRVSFERFGIRDFDLGFGQGQNVQPKETSLTATKTPARVS
jgi:hypothetical protein